MSKTPTIPEPTCCSRLRQTQLEKFSGMTLARDGGLWIAGARGLVKISGPVRNLKRDPEWHDYLPPEPLQLHNLQQPHQDEADVVTVVAESKTNQQKIPGPVRRRALDGRGSPGRTDAACLARPGQHLLGGEH